jgi:hypothetical protein
VEKLSRDLARAEEVAAGQGSPVGVVAVPPRRVGLEASALPQAYQDLLEVVKVVEDAGRPALGTAAWLLHRRIT